MVVSVNHSVVDEQVWKILITLSTMS